MAADSRSASSGETRDARSPGSKLTTVVTTIPVSRLTAIEPPVTDSPPAGSANPAASNRALSSSAMPSPAATPSAEPTVPTATASASTPRSTWPRLAPRARSRAASLVRWATRMPNVLAMENAATSSAIPANTTRMTRSAVRNSEFSVARLPLVSWAPVMACTLCGRARSSRLTSTSGLTPRAALTWMEETFAAVPPVAPLRVRYRCAP